MAGSEIINKGEIIVQIYPNIKYSSEITNLSKALASQNKKTIYVSLNTLTDTLQKRFTAAKISPDKFIFIDCVTKSIKPDAKDSENAIYLDSISSLTDMSIAITKAIQKGNAQAIIFDSLSTLLVYHKSAQAGKFIHALISRMRTSDMSAAFTALEGDAKSELMKEISMYVDRVQGIE